MEVLIQLPMEVLATMGPRAPPTLVAQGLGLLLNELRDPDPSASATHHQLSKHLREPLVGVCL